MSRTGPDSYSVGDSGFSFGLHCLGLTIVEVNCDR